MKLDNIGKYISEIQNGGSICVISDTNVAPLYMNRCVKSLEDAGYQVSTYVLEAGEESKNGENYLKILDYVSRIPLTRSDGIVALGGGMVGDISGFVAATFLRGIKVYQVPTTILSAVDSSVGGKTAIDLPAGKNLAGAFHQPALVLQDSELVATLPEEVYREGLAEVIKYGVIYDKEFFEVLKDPEYVRTNIGDIIRRCVEIKTVYVEEDEFDYGVRHMLNFGHTIGHAIELLSDYGLSHGYSVAKGMHWITRIAVEQGWCDQSVLDELIKILETHGFDISIDYDRKEVYDAMCSDKKRENDIIKLVVPETIGKSVIKTVTMDELWRIL